MDVYGILEKLKISRDYIRETVGRTRLNDIISEYFDLLFDEYGEQTYLAQSERILNCSRLWVCNHYQKSNVYDVQTMCHCRSRFCLNCQKLIQASRLNRFAPVLTDAANTYDLYHVVFTIPNVPGAKLKAAVKLLSSSFRRLIRFLRGLDKIHGLNFTSYGFYGALRSLEVTVNNSRDDYHPHYHCIFALKKGLNMPKTLTNQYSYDSDYDPFTKRYRKVFRRSFSEFEVLLQKLWRLIVESEREKIYRHVAITDALGKPLPSTHPLYGRFVPKPQKKNNKDGAITLNAIQTLDVGYSVIMDYISDDDELNFYEVFKYAFKITTDEQTLFTFDQFKTMFFALKGARTMQGYGAWYNLKCDDIDDSISEFYGVLVAYLRQSDTPISIQLSIDEVKDISDNNRGVFITKAAIQSALNDLSAHDAAQLQSVVPGTVAAAVDDSPLLTPKRLYMTDISVAYYRYLERKRTSTLFKALNRHSVPVSSNKTADVLVLSPEQMTFLSSIF